MRTAVPPQDRHGVPRCGDEPAERAVAAQSVGQMQHRCTSAQAALRERRRPPRPASRRGSRPPPGSVGEPRDRGVAGRWWVQCDRADPGQRRQVWIIRKGSRVVDGPCSRRRRRPRAAGSDAAHDVQRCSLAAAHSSPLSAVAECMTRPCPAAPGPSAPVGRRTHGEVLVVAADRPLAAQQVFDGRAQPLPGRLVLNKGLRRMVPVQQVDAHHETGLSLEGAVGQPSRPQPGAPRA